MTAPTFPLISDACVAAVPLIECGEPLVALGSAFGPRRARVRRSLADRLAVAASLLPDGYALDVVEGHRSVASQLATIARYRAAVVAAHPGADEADVRRLTGRFVAPLEVAPHVAGAAVDLTLVTSDRRPLDLGTAIDATPEESDGACYSGSTAVSAHARAHRDVLTAALEGAGLVNYPTEWWHWSFGDRYWAIATGAAHAVYGPMPGGRS